MLKALKAKVAVFFTVALGMVFPALTHANGAFNANNTYSGGSNLKAINSNVEDLSGDTFTMIKTLATLVGLVLVFIGVMRLKKSQDQNSGVSPMQGILLMVFGGLCAVLPWLLFTSANTVQGSGTTP